MLQVFEIVPVVSQIETIGGKRLGGAGVGGGGGWEAEGGVKALIQTQAAVPSVCEINSIDTTHKGSPHCHEEQLGIPCSLNNACDHKMHPCSLNSIDKRPSVKADLAIYCLA